MKAFNRQYSLAILIVTFCGVAIFGCEHSSSPFSHYERSEKEMRELIIGTWDWTYAIIMSRNLPPPKNRFTPDSVGYTMQREFMENGQVNFYTDGQLTETHTYEIKRFKILPSDASPVSMIYINDHPAQVRFLDSDTMMIGNGWQDGTDYYYARIK